MPIYNIDNPYLPQVRNLKNEDGSPILGYNASLNDILYQSLSGFATINQAVNAVSWFLQGANSSFNQYLCDTAQKEIDLYYQGSGLPSRKNGLIQIYDPMNGHTTNAHLKAFAISGVSNPDGSPYPFQSVQMQIKNLHTGNYVSQMSLNEKGLFSIEFNQTFSRLILVTEEISTDLSFGLTLV